MAKQGTTISRRHFLASSALLGGAALLGPLPAWAQAKTRVSVATGGTGGVYYPYGGGIASLITKHLPGVDATAEVTAASVDNCRLVGAKKADLGFSMADTAYDAFAGLNKFKDKVPLAAVGVLYSNFMHVVAVNDGKIKSVADMKGKKISTGAPGSGTEVKALRVLEAYGINPDKDIKRDRLGASESAGALKDGKVDAYFWDGGLPTASVLDLAATPGLSVALIPHGDAVPKMVEQYGPVYFASAIPKGTYPNQNEDVSVAGVGNVLVCHASADEKLIYDIAKAMFEHKEELVAIHKEALHLTLKDVVVGSPLPIHPGAAKYFKEKGAKL